MQRCMVYSTPLVCSWARVCNKPWAPLPLELVCSKPTNYEMRYSNIYNDYSVMNKYYLIHLRIYSTFGFSAGLYAGAGAGSGAGLYVGAGFGVVGGGGAAVVVGAGLYAGAGAGL